MKITIHEIDNDTIEQVKKEDSSFAVNSKLILHAENGKISYTVVEVPPYTKQYGRDEVDSVTYVDNPHRVIYFAYVDDELVGQIRLRKYWNGYGYVDYIAVDAKYRNQGVGHALIERSIAWAKAKGLPGLMLETQDNNVPACRFYTSCGFELRGFDTYLYKGQDPSTDEIALYWYLVF